MPKAVTLLALRADPLKQNKFWLMKADFYAPNFLHAAWLSLVVFIISVVFPSFARIFFSLTVGSLGVVLCLVIVVTLLKRWKPIRRRYIQTQAGIFAGIFVVLLLINWLGWLDNLFGLAFVTFMAAYFFVSAWRLASHLAWALPGPWWKDMEE